MAVARVLIVDDDLMVRSTLSRFLTASGMQVAGTCISGEEALQFVEHDETIDVILMDIRMDGMSGVTAARIINERHERPRVVMLTSVDEMGTAESARNAGTWGFLLKDILPETLAAAVAAVAAGVDVMAHLPPGHGRRYTEEILTEVANLSDREHGVLKALCDGQPNAAISDMVFASESTVKADILSLQRRLGVSNRTQLAILAHDLGLDRTPNRHTRRQ